jgi:hypothetical protein
MKGKFKRWWSTIPSISTKQTTIVISDIKPREIMTCHLKIFSGNLIQNLYILYIYLHLIKITSLTCSPFWHVTVCQIWRNTTTVTCQWSYVYYLLTCHSVPDLKKHHYSHMSVILRLLFIDMSQCARSEETPLQSQWSYVYSLLTCHSDCQIWRNTTTVTCQWSYVYSLLTCHSDCQIWRNTTTVTVILRLLFIDMSQCARSEETPLQSHAWVILRLLKKPHRWCNG